MLQFHWLSRAYTYNNIHAGQLGSYQAALDDDVASIAPFMYFLKLLITPPSSSSVSCRHTPACTLLSGTR